ncbi:MAG TPA: phosphomannomutase/phosphoglucomutase [Acidobacteriota bacterium]|mgnify:CR=1 FL=1|nr:phosphomannomutase/phosphoglucomutase [Acidobacteriota bacterium]HNR38256.1 phosphomannomutase/phosphoglucomutase [Acidobacteriota bacterium]HNU00737.1 phosphomannomutase/phosphoglucomutase [Acidobacteriota bacterium]HUN19435.1 phosphomannomutase/phosphoglucomutase [Caldisericia bacterium]
MQIPVPHVFKRYDIRGIVGEELTPELATAIGRATGTYLRRRGRADVVVGRDGRLSGPEYAARLIDGLRAAGVRVLDLGICPTPVMYFAIHHLGAGGGIAVTASHNPPEYNGFKINCGPDSLYDDAIQEIRRLIEAEDYESGDAPVERRPMLPDYAAALRQQFGELASRPKVVVDAGNGTAALVAPDLLRSLKCRVAELYCTVDGRFPNHEADPTVAGNLADLIRVVREQSADLGIAFDGDGDRIGVVDETGTILHGDQLLLIYARQVLAARPGATVISEVKSSQVLYDEIARAGGRPLMWKTGHSLIKAKMKETGAALAGEMSGHMFFADRYYGFDDAIYAACRLLEILDAAGQPLSRLLADLPGTVNTPELRHPCPEAYKAPLVQAVLNHYRRDHEVIDLDGVRVRFPGGWGLVRASNTQPILVLRFEADTPGRLQAIQDEVMAVIRKYQREIVPS